MAIYFMFGKYSSDAMKAISAERTQKSAALVKKYGGDVKSIHALLGEHDLVCIVEFPNTEHAMKASVALAKLTGISFTTSEAVTVDVFDKMMEDV